MTARGESLTGGWTPSPANSAAFSSPKARPSAAAVDAATSGSTVSLDELQEQPRQTLVAARRQHDLEAGVGDGVDLGRPAAAGAPARGRGDQPELAELLQVGAGDGAVEAEDLGHLARRLRTVAGAQVAVDVAPGGIAEDVGQTAQIHAFFVVCGLHVCEHIALSFTSQCFRCSLGTQSRFPFRRTAAETEPGVVTATLLASRENLRKRYACPTRGYAPLTPRAAPAAGTQGEEQR